MSTVKPPDVPRRYGGQSAEARIAERRDALLEAAFALVAERGWPALRIDALCRQAGLNKRYFYESFANLDAVAEALTAGLAESSIAVTLAATAPDLDPAEATRRMIGALVRYLTDDPRRARVLFGAIPAGESAASHRQRAIHQIIVAAAEAGAELHAVGKDPAVRVAASMLVGGTSQAILDWLDAEPADGSGGGAGAEAEARAEARADQDGLVDLLVAMWQVVGAEAARRAGSSAAAA